MMNLLDRLGIDVPILQAPMAGIGTPALAAAVCNAGALGSLGVGAMNADTARNAIRETRQLTDRPFNVNVFCHTPPTPDAARESAWLSYLAPLFARFGAIPPTALREIYTSFNTDKTLLAVLMEERPAVVSFHFGLPPAGHIAALRDTGIFLMACATTLDEARQIEVAGIDAVIAQGFEAGGHRGTFDAAATGEGIGTLALTRLLVREQSLPVIATGGIMDGAGIAAVLALGAQAAQLGTAFISCPESAADPAFRVALLSPAAEHTALTMAISGRLARGLVNGFTALGAAADRPPIPGYPTAYDAGKALQMAAKAAGNGDYTVQLAGQAARLSRAMPAADLIRLLRTEYTQALRSE